MWCPICSGWFPMPYPWLGRTPSSSKLPYYELDKATIRKPRANIRPFRYPKGFTKDPNYEDQPDPPNELTIDSSRLAHAIIKADCARRAPLHILDAGASGFLLEHKYLFEWHPDNLRLAESMAAFYADFSRTSLSGRIAQGMAILFMEERSFPFVERFATALRLIKAGKHPRVRLSGNVPSKIPDFIFQEGGNGTGEFALVESKGGFVDPKEDAPNIKGALGEALGQLDGWDTVLSPAPRQTFAIATYLRESVDLREEPSLIAYVKSEEEPLSTSHTKPRHPHPKQFSQDMLRRGNYSAWLWGMGFVEFSKALQLSLPYNSPSGTYRKLRLGDEEYALTVLGWRTNASRTTRIDIDLGRTLSDPMFWLPNLLFDGVVLHVMGISTSVLKQLQDAVNKGKSGDLNALTLPSKLALPYYPQIKGWHIKGSVFSDGTFLGDLHVDNPSTNSLAWTLETL